MIDMECNEFLVFGRGAEEQTELSPGLRSSILNHNKRKKNHSISQFTFKVNKDGVIFI